MLRLLFKSSVAFTFFIHCMLVLPAVQQLTSYEEITNCGRIKEEWKPSLSLIADSKNNRTLILYTKPNDVNVSKAIESLTFYLFRSDNSFNCAQTSYPSYKTKNMRFYLSKGLLCNIIYSDQLIKITNDVVLLVRPPSHKTLTWIVVGTLVVMGVFFAFALEVACKRCRSSYARVAVVERRELCSMESRKISGESLAREVTGRLLIFYAYENEVHFQLVKQFVDVLRQTLPNWEFIVDQEHVNDICTLGAVRWVEDNLHKANRVILISSEGSFRQTRANPNFDAVIGNADINYVFAIGWNFLLNDPTLRGNYAKVFNILFECTRPEFTLTSVVPNRSFLIPNDYVELINHILGCNSWADAFCQDLKGTLKHMVPYSSFVDAVERHARQQGLSHGLGSQDFCWVRPGL